MRKLLILFLFIGACGTEKREPPNVNPTAYRLVVGYQAHYVLDPSRSNLAIKSGNLTATIIERNEDNIFFTMQGAVNTSLGSKPIDMKGRIPINLLNTDFLAKIRSDKSHDEPDFKLRYQKPIGACDLIRTIDIKGFEWIKIDGLLCVESENVPELTANFTLFGQNIKAVFLLKN